MAGAEEEEEEGCRRWRRVGDTTPQVVNLTQLIPLLLETGNPDGEEEEEEEAKGCRPQRRGVNPPEVAYYAT